MVRDFTGNVDIVEGVTRVLDKPPGKEQGAGSKEQGAKGKEQPANKPVTSSSRQ